LVEAKLDRENQGMDIVIQWQLLLLSGPAPLWVTVGSSGTVGEVNWQ